MSIHSIIRLLGLDNDYENENKKQETLLYDGDCAPYHV